MERCWSSEPHERGTFDDIENLLTTMLAGDFKDLACHRYYQFVPIRDTEIAGVVKDCGLRSNSRVEEIGLKEEDHLEDNGDDNENMMQQRRRFSC